jgi:hypothetical protein
MHLTIFNINSITSKIQSFVFDEPKKNIIEIIKCTLLKGSETMFGILQICDINKNFKEDLNYVLLCLHLGFIFQLLDDLCDIDQDVKEKNITLFNYPILYNQHFDEKKKDEFLKSNVIKLINYVFNFKNILNDIQIDGLTQSKKNMYFNIIYIYLNYAISKYHNIRNMLGEYEGIFLFKFSDIYNFRELKYNLFEGSF